MARFQSRLFNWIDLSLPAQLGRKARDWYEQFGNPVRQATESIKKTTTKAILYPVFILASATNLRAKSHRVPLLLRPVQSLVLWIDNTKIYTVQRSNFVDNTNNEYSKKLNQKSLNSTKSLKRYRNSNQNITKFERLFLKDKNQSLSLNNSGADLNRIRRLIKDAIAYFFGSNRKNKLKSPAKKAIKLSKTNQPWLTMTDVFDDDASIWPPLAIERSGLNESIEDGSEAIANYKLSDKSTNELARSDRSQINSLDITNSSHKITTQSQELTSSIPPDSRPLHAWLETQSTFLGYVYDPFRQLIDWLDRLIANMERWIIRFWQKLITLICGFF